MHTLSQLVGSFALSPLDSNQGKLFISALVTDSRQAQKDCLFFAISGDHRDGHSFIPQVLAQGAAAIIHEKELSKEIQRQALLGHTVLIQVEQSRRVLSHASATWFDNPAQKLALIGVTGTDGKSSTVFFVHQLFRFCGIKSGFFSTVAMHIDDMLVPNGLRQSTPEAPELHEVLAKMVASGCTHGVIETTSHGLSHKTSRLRDVPFSAGIFTNLSHEHLEFHGSYENYRSDKANLFRELSEAGDFGPPFAILNASDTEYDYFAGVCPYTVLSYSSETTERVAAPATLRATDIRGHSDECTCVLHYDPAIVAGSGLSLSGPAGNGELRIPLPGTFNIENTMAALLCVAAFLKVSPLSLLGYLEGLQGVKGRMVPVRRGQAFSVIIDYAHTPGAFRKVLPLFQKSTKGRLIAVFGSAGERDKEKRQMQGALAARYCDELVLTNEDPRLENEMEIIQAIYEGAKAENANIPIHCIPDRFQAIHQACSLAGPGDTVILLGKGHEQSIFDAKGKNPWDEETKAVEALAALGWA